MKVLFNIHNLTNANGGILQYACTLLKIFGKDVDNEYFVLHNTKSDVVTLIVNEYPNLTLIPFHVGKEKDVEKLFRFVGKLHGGDFSKGGFKIKIPIISRIERVCKKYKIDILYCPFQEVSLTTRRQITTLHDVQELHFPEFFSPAERLERASLFKKITEQSDLIVVSYDHVKKDLIKFFQRNTDDVMVCLLDMQRLWFDNLSTLDVVSLNNYRIPEKFIFYPAVTWPHKNHIGLLRAIAHLRDTENVHLNVVFTGHQTEFKKEIDLCVKQLELEEQVYWLGVVSEKTLYTLYNATLAVVVPTLYEAGSFPLMESMLMNIPVVCSNVTSLPDTIGNNCYVFDPSNISDMADKVKKISTDDQYRQANLENSERQRGKLRNTNALSKLKLAMKRLYDEPSTPKI